MQGKKVYAFGDSIVYGHTMPDKSFMRLIAKETGISLGMYAVNGATVIRSENAIQIQIENAPQESPDLIVLDGYTNDAYERNLGMLGEILPEGTEGFDDATFCGGFEKILYTIRSKWPEVPVLYVTIHKSGGRDYGIQCRMRELALAMCDKWGAQVADIFADCALDTRDSGQMRDMIIDGAGSHPNETCCGTYYVPLVLGKMQVLLGCRGKENALETETGAFMDFTLKQGQRCVLKADSREPEAVKIALSNLVEDLKKTLGIMARIAWTDRKDKDEDYPGEKADTDNIIGLAEAGAGAMDVVPDGEGNEAHIIIGTLGISSLAGEQVCGLLPRDDTGRPRKEAYLHQVLDGSLVIAGSDRRGTIYGIYEMSEMLGVSPWYFWADVPVKGRQEFVLPKGYCKADYPSVEYRGIFLNDEEELESWVRNYMGEPTIGVKTYEKVFELLLRLKGNYIWPAMHVNSFNLTPENGALADRMGIVVGTSHCDMLMRSNNREWVPWIQKKGYTDAVYDYTIEGRNREILQEYWRESVEQNRDYEVCYTLGMRGIHDSGFETKNLAGKSEGEKRAAKVALLEQIIGDQREILRKTLGVEEADPGDRKRDMPMMTFIPYKEVLELYDNGLQVPEDMTLVWANDNYGYIRRYPSEREKHRKGGNGIYYHNSYWAPPSMSYVFLCSIPLAHTRNELQKAWNEGIRKLWVMNTGAMKPLEQEITFFLRLAWEIGKPGALTEDVDAFVEDWINRTFSGQEELPGSLDMADGREAGGGETFGRKGTVVIGKEVSRLLNDFSQLTNVRKIENMDYDAFSQTAYGDEAVVRIHAYEELFQRGNALYESLSEAEKAAFFQLVLMRIHAAYFTNLAYYYGDRSTWMYDRGNMQAAAYYVEQSREAEDARRRLLHYYNHVMCRGKWKGILDPEGFPPPRAAMMPVCTPPLAVLGTPSMDVEVWNGEEELVFATPGEKWLGIGNQGEGAFEVRLRAPEWVKLSEGQPKVSREVRILVNVSDVSENRSGEILVENVTDGSSRVILVRTVKPVYGTELALEEDGLVVLEAWQGVGAGAGTGGVEAWQERPGAAGVQRQRCAKETGREVSGDFKRIPRLGRLYGDLAEACVCREPEEYGIRNEATARDRAGKDCTTSRIPAAKPLCYHFAVYSSGEFLLEIHRFPSLDSVGRIRIGVSLDEGPIQIVESFSNDEWRGNWKKNVLDNVDRLCLRLPRMEAGRHTLSLWAVDRYFAFSRLVLYTRPRKENNLAGVRGYQALPREWKMGEWCREFYGEYELSPRPVYYASYESGGDNLGATCQKYQAKQYGQKAEPDWYLERGKHAFEETDGAVRIDAAAALAQSVWAWTEDVQGQQRLWRHCASESFGRSGLALYIRIPGLRWQAPDAPCLHYRFRCAGGTYTLWMLSKFNMREESVFAVAFDSSLVPQEQLYRNGSLWRYEAEQIYRWVPVACVELDAGEHVLGVYALAPGMRYDRFYLTRGQEQPPVDSDWIPEK